MLCVTLKSLGRDRTGEAELKVWSGLGHRLPPVSVPNFSGAEGCDRQSWRKVIPCT